MMKKLLFIIIFVFGYFNQFSVHANQKNDLLIVEVGIGDDAYLEMKDCILQQHNVRWDKIGSYVAQYYDTVTERFIQRQVEIIQPQQMNDGIMIQKSMILDVFNQPDYTILDVVFQTDDSVFVVGSYDPKHEQIQTNFVQTYGFIRYYKNQQLQWERLFDTTYSYVAQVESTSIGVICLMAYAVGEGSKLKLLEITPNGNIAREKSFGGNNIHDAWHLRKLDGMLCVLATSNATSGEFSYTYQTQYIVYFTVDYQTLTIIDTIYFGNNQATKILDIFFDDLTNSFYILTFMRGTIGRHQNAQGGYQGHFILHIAALSCHHSVQNLSIMETPRYIFTQNNEIVVITEDILNQTTKVSFYFYSPQMQYKREVNWTYPNQNYRFATFFIQKTIFDNVIITVNVSHKTTQETICGGLLLLDPYLHFFPLVHSNSPTLFLEVYNFDKIRMLTASENIKYHQIYILQKEMITSEDIQYQTYKRERVLFNGSPCIELGLPFSNPTIFGAYRIPYTLDETHMRLVLTNTFYIKEQINIQNATYDTGIVLEFNGNGFLNDVAIESGYCIDAIGTYSLIVYGTQNERKIINFDVRQLSLGQKEIDYSPIHHIEIWWHKEAVDTSDLIPLTTRLREENDEPLIFVYVLLGFSCFIALGFVVPIKKWGKK